jgi:hypothetical protein
MATAWGRLICHVTENSSEKSPVRGKGGRATESENVIVEIEQLNPHLTALLQVTGDQKWLTTIIHDVDCGEIMAWIGAKIGRL